MSQIKLMSTLHRNHIEMKSRNLMKGCVLAVLLRIQAAAFEQLIEIRHQTKLGLQYALSRRKHFVCELDVRPVQIMLPYEGAANRKYEPFFSYP